MPMRRVATSGSATLRADEVGEVVAILGASDHPHRFSYKAKRALQAAGHTSVLVNPRLTSIEGVPCYPDFASCPEKVDTVTVYVRPSILRGLLNDLLELRPRRVILNPGSEERTVIERLQKAGIDVEIACTLVMLSCGTF